MQVYFEDIGAIIGKGQYSAIFKLFTIVEFKLEMSAKLSIKAGWTSLLS